MVSERETADETKALLKLNLPKAIVERVDVRQSTDSDGQASLDVWIVFKTRPPKEEMRQANNVIDELRTWLQTKGDGRFPYFEFITTQEEKELSQIK